MNLQAIQQALREEKVDGCFTIEIWGMLLNLLNYFHALLLKDNGLFKE